MTESTAALLALRLQPFSAKAYNLELQRLLTSTGIVPKGLKFDSQVGCKCNGPECAQLVGPDSPLGMDGYTDLMLHGIVCMGKGCGVRYVIRNPGIHIRVIQCLCTAIDKLHYHTIAEWFCTVKCERSYRYAMRANNMTSLFPKLIELEDGTTKAIEMDFQRCMPAYSLSKYFTLFVKCMCCRKQETEKTPHLTCSSCLAVAYCSLDCQRKDWYLRHKDHCKALKG
jgi:hypothetical protein